MQPSACNPVHVLLSPCLQEGFNKLNRRAAADHLEVEKHIKVSGTWVCRVCAKPIL